MNLYKWSLSFEEYATLYMGDFYQIHQKVWYLFGEKMSDRKFLYRVLRNSSDVSIIIQSIYPAEKEPLLGSLTHKTIKPDFRKEERYLISATLNPVIDKSRLHLGKKNSARIPLTRYEDIREWAFRLFEKKGFQSTNLNISPIRKEYSQRKNKTMSICDITGLFKVTNEIKAVETFKIGIGKSKAFGCGLLFITPVGECITTSDENEDNDDI